MRKKKDSYLIFNAIRGIALLTPMIFAMPAWGTTDQADLSVAMKTLPLLTNKITGSAPLTILFDPANPVSRQEADGIKSIVDNGFEVPVDLKLTPVLTPITNLSTVAGSRIVILTGGLGAYYNAISEAFRNKDVLTMSTDLSCVQANKCVLGIASKPHVEIYYSKIAADKTNISFGQVFMMLIKQI